MQPKVLNDLIADYKKRTGNIPKEAAKKTAATQPAPRTRKASKK
jgi:hypothetical protein